MPVSSVTKNKLKKVISSLKQSCKTHNRVLSLQKARIVKELEDALETSHQKLEVIREIERELIA